MTKVIEFHYKRTKMLVGLGQDYDRVTLKVLQEGILSTEEIATIMANRLGELISIFPKENKQELINFCTNMIAQKAWEE